MSLVGPRPCMAYEAEEFTVWQRKRFRAGDLLAGRYKILSELGQGGMGLVYRCLDEVGGIEVAVKIAPNAQCAGSMPIRENGMAAITTNGVT